MRGKARTILMCFPIALLIVSLGACNNWIHTAYDAASIPDYVYQKPRGDNPHFSYIQKAPPDVTIGEADMTHEHYDVRYVTFASTGRNGQVGNRAESYYFKSQTPGRKPLVIVLPIWGVDEYPSEKISQGYADRSQGEAHIIWLQGDQPLFDSQRLRATLTEKEFMAEAKESVRRFETTIIDVRRLLDWIETQAEIDASRIGIIGFSIGAVMAANIVANEPRVDTAVFVMGGGHPWKIFSTCDLSLGKVRQHVLTDFGWSRDQYEDFFHGILSHGDPIRWAGRYNPQRILIIEAGKDRCVPKVSRDALWVATGKPERISLPYDHWMAFLSLTPLGFSDSPERIYEFFDQQLVQQHDETTVAESPR